MGGTKDFGAVLTIGNGGGGGELDDNSNNGSKIDDEEKENEKALRRMSLPVEVATDEEDHVIVNPKVLVSQV